MRYVQRWASAHGVPVPEAWYVMKGKTTITARAEKGPFATPKEAERELLALEKADEPQPKPEKPPKPTKAPKPLPSVKEFDKKVLAREAKKGAAPKKKKPAPKKKGKR